MGRRHGETARDGWPTRSFFWLGGHGCFTADCLRLAFRRRGRWGMSLHGFQGGAIAFSAPGEAGFVHCSMPSEKGLA